MRERENYNSGVTPHFDGEKESIINDTMATQSAQMGIQVETTKSNSQEQNPLHLSKNSPNIKMEKFEKLMRGNKVGE